MLGTTVFQQHPEAEADDHQTRFHKSLQELGELRSQLHHAADYCEAIFLNAPQKHMVIENTKEYLCRAIVTVVDHLGTVSANLDHQLSKTNSVSETELRMNNLKQKLTTCQQYSHKLALSRLSWNADFPRYRLRYVMQPIPNLRRSNAILREPGDAPKPTSTTIKPFLVEDSSNVSKRNSFSTPGKNDLNPSNGMTYYHNHKFKNFAVLPAVQDGLVLQPKSQHQLFQFQEKRKLKRRMLNWKPMENKDLISLIRLSKRAT